MLLILSISLIDFYFINKHPGMVFYQGASQNVFYCINLYQKLCCFNRFIKLQFPVKAMTAIGWFLVGKNISCNLLQLAPPFSANTLILSGKISMCLHPGENQVILH